MIIWDLIVNAVYIISFFLIPYALIDPNDLLPKVIWIELALDLIIFADVIMDFFTAYRVDNDLVFDHKQIIANYLSTYFVFDLLSVVPGLFTAEQYHEVYFMKIFRYSQFTRFLEMINSVLNKVCS